MEELTILYRLTSYPRNPCHPWITLLSFPPAEWPRRAPPQGNPARVNQMLDDNVPFLQILQKQYVKFHFQFSGQHSFLCSW